MGAWVQVWGQMEACRARARVRNPRLSSGLVDRDASRDMVSTGLGAHAIQFRSLQGKKDTRSRDLCGNILLFSEGGWRGGRGSLTTIDVAWRSPIYVASHVQGLRASYHRLEEGLRSC